MAAGYRLNNPHRRRAAPFRIFTMAGCLCRAFFVKKYLPDFTPADFEEVLNEYAGRQRRFGR